MADEHHEEWVIYCPYRHRSVFIPGGEPSYLVNINGRDERGRIPGQDFPGCDYAQCGVNNYLRVRGEEG